MLKSRIIPCLLLKGNSLVKTIKFKDPKYVGDPINAVRIFNEKKVDELMIFDISATKNKRSPNYKLIKQLANQCRMPLCYGGGVNTLDQIIKIISLGVEKVSICTSAINNRNLIKEASDYVGSQSVVVCVDLKKTKFFNKYTVFSNTVKKKIEINPINYFKEISNQGAGEIVINFIDRDGTMLGYDIEYIEEIKKNITIPLTILGGAGSYDDMGSLIQKFKLIGAGAGSLFVFKGKYRAVLITYPNDHDKKIILN